MLELEPAKQRQQCCEINAATESTLLHTRKDSFKPRVVSVDVPHCKNKRHKISVPSEENLADVVLLVETCGVKPTRLDSLDLGLWTPTIVNDVYDGEEPFFIF